MPAMSAPPAGAMPPAKVLVLAGQGDLVVQVTSRSMPGGKDAYIFNMFRVQDGRLAEHWDATSGASLMGRAPGAPNPSAKP
jgi:predicted SnoaL-like aldol condensation-catalyzing enzyme